MKSFPAIILGFLIVCAAALILYLWASDPDAAERIPTAEVAPPEIPTPATTPAPLPWDDTAPPPSDRAPEPEGPDRISEILSDQDIDFPTAVGQLLRALPRLSPDEQLEAAHHIANLSEDETTSLWLPPLVADRLPEPATEILFHDLLNRPEELLYPNLSTMADNPEHSMNAASVEILEVLFDLPPEDSNWSRWVAAQLAEEAAERESAQPPEE